MDEASKVGWVDANGDAIVSIRTLHLLFEIDWLGARHVADVLLSEGTDQLIGTALLQGTRLKIDYLANTVEIEKP